MDCPLKVQSRYSLLCTNMTIDMGIPVFQELCGCDASSTCWTQKVGGHPVIANAVGDWHVAKHNCACIKY